MEAKTQMTAKRWMTAADVTAMEDYARARGARREAIRALKKDRRVAVGPDATFYFECFETMLHQVHEMLFVEKGGAAQLAGELEAYNPLVPQGRELVATFMIEIAEPARRARVLAELGGIEEAITLGIDGETVCAKAERDVDRTELYIADELFICGSAEEVTPIISVDKVPVGDGKPGPVTRELQGMLFRAARGQDPDYEQELVPVY